MSDEQKGGKLIRTLHECALYPPHPPRKPTALYVRNHHKLVVVQDRPCIVCGVRNSDLQDPKRREDPNINPWGASHIETHHRIIEDSLANAIDLAKFNKRIRMGMLRKTKNKAKYGHDFTQEEMLEWIHGDEDQLWPICDIHHRSPLVGIHSITFNVWNVQNLLFDGYDLTSFHAHTKEEAAQLTALPTTTGQAEPPKETSK